MQRIARAQNPLPVSLSGRHIEVRLGHRHGAIARGGDANAARRERRAVRLVAAVNPPMRLGSGNIVGASLTHGIPPRHPTNLLCSA